MDDELRREVSSLDQPSADFRLGAQSISFCLAVASKVYIDTQKAVGCG